MDEDRFVMQAPWPPAGDQAEGDRGFGRGTQ